MPPKTPSKPQPKTQPKKTAAIDEEVIEATMDMLDERTPAERAQTLQDALANWCITCGEDTDDEGECPSGCSDEDDSEEDETDGTPDEDGDDEPDADEHGGDAGEPE
jgi:hypothetical protein